MHSPAEKANNGYAYQYLNLSIDERGVARVALNRPDQRNAMNAGLMDEIADVFKKLDKAPNVKTAVLSGEGKVFSAGADMGWMKAMVGYSYEENVEDCKHFTGMLASLYEFSKPLIGKVHGAAIGGGIGLASACDYVVAQEGAKFGYTEVNLGIYPAMISPYSLPRIGEHNARELFKSGRLFTAEEANACGLVEQIAAAGNLEQDVNKIVEFALERGKAGLRARSAQLRGQRTDLPNSEYKIESDMLEKVDALVDGVLKRQRAGKSPSQMDDFTIPFTAEARVTERAQAKLREALENMSRPKAEGQRR